MKKIFIGLAVVAGTVATIVCNEKFNWGLGKKVTNGYDRAKNGLARAFSKAATETTENTGSETKVDAKVDHAS